MILLKVTNMKSQKREFLNLIPIVEAQQIIQANFSWIPKKENISIKNALNRVLASDIIAPIDNPPFDRSLMDGFAVRAEDTFDIDEIHPKTFEIIDTIPAGRTSNIKIENSFDCIEISTGAPIPSGANAVIMIEHTSRISENTVKIFRAASPYDNIDPQGSDIMYGETVLREGNILSPVRLGIIAALGLNRIEVNSQLRVGIMSSGDEIISPGSVLTPGSLYDSNSPVLEGLLKESGIVPINFGICPDNPVKLMENISQAIKSVDILLISGGTSAGEGDYSYRSITDLGGQLLFHGVAMKPGKPLAVGTIKNSLIVTLPGFPASAIFSFNSVILPLINKWMKTPLKQSKNIDALLKQKIRSTTGRTNFKHVHIINDNEDFVAFPVRGTSGSLTMLERADGFLTIEENREFLLPGDRVEVTLLKDKMILPDIVFIGSHDFIIDHLFKMFRKIYPEYHVKLIYVGSSKGFSAINIEECDIAGVHLLDEKSGEYNQPFVDKWNMRERVTLIKGYTRSQGLYVPKGNPMRIKNLEDLVNKDITFLNRNEGSGTRILLEILLSRLDFQKNLSEKNMKESIKGYNSVAYSHSATANAVAQNKVDVSIGIKSYADLLDIDFLPLSKEKYDFIVQKNSQVKPAVRKLLELFHTSDFRQYVENIIGHVEWENNDHNLDIV
ncbi:MAG: molybdopterin biosynthesis protein [Candidatus Hodarchaeales archaeon]|jgi:putative molybdopterin biosynthesis protein